jgi:hypothetical protein
VEAIEIEFNDEELAALIAGLQDVQAGRVREVGRLKLEEPK